MRLRFSGGIGLDACEETMLAPGGWKPPPLPLEEVAVGQGEWELAVGS